MIKKTVFAGFGGQGVLMMGYVTAVSAMMEGKHVTYLPSYGAEVRGGTANCTVAVSEEEIFSPVASAPDYAVIMNKPSLDKYEGTIKEGGIIVLNSSLVDRAPSRDDVEVLYVPANDMAIKAGSGKATNVAMLGAFVGATGIVEYDNLVAVFKEKLGRKKDLLSINLQVIKEGYDLGRKIHKKGVKA